MLDLGSPFFVRTEKESHSLNRESERKVMVFMSVFIGSILTQYSHTLYCYYFLHFDISNKIPIFLLKNCSFLSILR